MVFIIFYRLKIKFFILDFNFARVDCIKLTSLDICTRLNLVKYPTFVLFKSSSFILNEKVDMGEDNWYEIHYGNRVTSEDLASFVKENAYTSVRTLTDFSTQFIENETKKHNKLAFFVDFFAPVS